MSGQASDEYRKRRAPLACAECRRLKLKCDRKVPCSSCTKRGCGAVCPNGTLAAGPGNRFVLADTRHLHEQIESLSKKISELEDVLAGLHTGDEVHPLLTEEHMLVKALPSTEKANDASNRPLAGLLGTLAVGTEPHFYGPNAASDYLLDTRPAAHGIKPLGVTDLAASTLPPDMLALARTFPLANLSDMRERVWPRLEALMPPMTLARTLADSFYNNAGWMFEVVPRDEFEKTLFKKVYKDGVKGCLADLSPHDVGLFSIMLALGALVDVDREPYSTEASDLYQTARVALSLDSSLDHPTVQAVRAVHVVSWFLHMTDHPASVTIAYNLLGLNAQLCHSLGLHRDDTPWNLESGEKMRRRTALWDVVSFDCWVAEALGRPPSFSVLHLDARLPEEVEEPGAQTFRQWIHTFTSSCVLKVLDQAFGVTRLTHATVLRLDRLVRESAQVKGPTLRIVNVGKPEELVLIKPDDPSIVDANEKEATRIARVMQRTTVFVLTQKCLMYLHRSYFAQALTDAPADPLKSKYAQSVLAAFRAAFYITASVRAAYTVFPRLTPRFWFLWSEAFSACVILGSIVARSPGSGLAPAAWVELDRMHELFCTLAAEDSSRCIERLLGKLRRLRNAAKAKYDEFTGGGASSSPATINVEEMMDEMEMKYGTGHTRLVDSAAPVAAPAPAPVPAPAPAPVPQAPPAPIAVPSQALPPAVPPPVPQPLLPLAQQPMWLGHGHLQDQYSLGHQPPPSQQQQHQQQAFPHPPPSQPFIVPSQAAPFPDLGLGDAFNYQPPPLPLLPQTIFDDGIGALGVGMDIGVDPLQMLWNQHQQQQQQMYTGTDQTDSWMGGTGMPFNSGFENQYMPDPAFHIPMPMHPHTQHQQAHQQNPSYTG